MTPRAGAVLVALAVAVTLSACSPDDGVRAVEPASPFQPCPPVTSAEPAIADGSRRFPSVALPCFTGGGRVELARLGRPAVINLWASYCRPCRSELPELQRLADANRGRLVVIGVVTADVRSAAAWAAKDLGISFPSVVDPDRRLLSALGRNALPVTLFVDAAGVVRHEDVSGALTLATLETLVSEHLGAP